MAVSTFNKAVSGGSVASPVPGATEELILEKVSAGSTSSSVSLASNSVVALQAFPFAGSNPEREALVQGSAVTLGANPTYFEATAGNLDIELLSSPFLKSYTKADQSDDTSTGATITDFSQPGRPVVGNYVLMSTNDVTIYARPGVDFSLAVDSWNAFSGDQIAVNGDLAISGRINSTTMTRANFSTGTISTTSFTNPLGVGTANVSYSDGYWVITGVAASSIAYSTDGTTWSTVAAPVNGNNLIAIYINGTLYVYNPADRQFYASAGFSGTYTSKANIQSLTGSLFSEYNRVNLMNLNGTIVIQALESFVISTNGAATFQAVNLSLPHSDGTRTDVGSSITGGNFNSGVLVVGPVYDGYIYGSTAVSNTLEINGADVWASPDAINWTRVITGDSVQSGTGTSIRANQVAVGAAGIGIFTYNTASDDTHISWTATTTDDTGEYVVAAYNTDIA